MAGMSDGPVLDRLGGITQPMLIVVVEPDQVNTAVRAFVGKL